MPKTGLRYVKIPNQGEARRVNFPWETRPRPPPWGIDRCIIIAGDFNELDLIVMFQNSSNVQHHSLDRDILVNFEISAVMLIPHTPRRQAISYANRTAAPQELRIALPFPTSAT